MNDFLTDDTKAVLLLCGVFGKNCSAKPLPQREYTSLVHWLISVKMRPADLLKKDNIADAAMGAKLDKERLESLLGRGVQLGFAVEEWQRNGIWIISRSDADYPGRYKTHLKDKAPPLLFGVGKRSLLRGGGLAVIGSRNVDKQGESFTCQVAELCARNEIPVVSGGARGVDTFAMAASMDGGGVTIGVIAENLLKKSLQRSARHAIAEGRLLLISSYHPKARFTVGTAMARNKLIYAMADYGLVVNAEHKKGGTWAGATEELKRDKPRTVFVRMESNVPQGNMKLLELGAIVWPKNIEKDNLKQQLDKLADNNQKKPIPNNMTLFDFAAKQEGNSTATKQKNGGTSSTENETIVAEQPKSHTKESYQKKPVTIYEVVLPVILNQLKADMNSDELAKSLNINKAQLNSWLKKAVEDGFVRKYSRPVRYKALEHRTAQQSN